LRLELTANFELLGEGRQAAAHPPTGGSPRVLWNNRSFDQYRELVLSMSPVDFYDLSGNLTGTSCQSLQAKEEIRVVSA